MATFSVNLQVTESPACPAAASVVAPLSSGAQAVGVAAAWPGHSSVMAVRTTGKALLLVMTALKLTGPLAAAGSLSLYVPSPLASLVLATVRLTGRWIRPEKQPLPSGVLPFFSTE